MFKKLWLKQKNGCLIKKRVGIEETMQKLEITENCWSSSDVNLDCISRFKEIRTQNINVIIDNLNINSIAFKFDELRSLVTCIFGILIIIGTKIDETFSLSQFHVVGFSKPYRLERNRNDCGIIIYIREDIPNKLLTRHRFSKDITELFIEVNFRKCTWLLYRRYHPPSSTDQYFFENIDQALDVYCTNEKVILGENFNSKVGKNCIDTFMYHHHSQNTNTQPYKNPNNLTCIDLFLTNSSRSFYKTETLFTGLSDFHKVILSIFKTTFTKSRAKETRKATSLKSLPLNCWVIAQVTKKFQISTSLSKILY